MTKATRPVASIAAMIAAAVLLAACGGSGSPSTGNDVQASPAPVAMSTEARDALPDGFPIEVPAMSGEVVEVDTDDTELGPWYYVMESPSERDAVASWYRQAYVGRSWQVADEATGDNEHVLVMTKGAGAWSTVRVHRIDSGSRIECWTGIGVPMPPEALPPAGAAASEV